MKEKEFKKLKVGDKVRIVSKSLRPNIRYNWNPMMDKWLDKVMTIREILNDGRLRMIEDKGEHCGIGWCWDHRMIAEKVEYPIIVEHLIRGNKTIVKLSNGKVGVAKCSPEDEFDYYEGLRIATARAYGKDEFKEVDRPAKLGEYIKIINPSVTFNRYGKGDILKVSEVKFGGLVCCETSFGTACIGKSEYVVLENHKPEVKREFKCSAVDAITSFAEAMRAWAKAFAPEVKEVKRRAEVGEYVKIVKPECTWNTYKEGDILKVVDNSLFSDMVGCETRNGRVPVLDREYVVLENYKPEVEEVNRKAKVGEYVKIVNTKGTTTWGKYSEGDILKVVEASICHNMVVCETPKGRVGVLDREYVVLEGYKPEEKKVEEPEVKEVKVKEVKRCAKVGEYIKITNADQSQGCYANGDILKVYAFEYSEITHKRRGVFCNTKRRLPNDTTVSNNDGNPVIFDNEYVVLENYKPEKK